MKATYKVSRKRKKVKVKAKVTQLCLTLCDLMDCSPWNFPGQNMGVGSLALLQGIFPTQRSNLGLPHCRQILYQLSHRGSKGKKSVGIQIIHRDFAKN